MNEPCLKMKGRLDQSKTPDLLKQTGTINDLPVVTATMKFPKESLLFSGFTADYNWWQRFKIWLKPAFPNIKTGPFHVVYTFTVAYGGWNDSKVVDLDSGKVLNVEMYRTSSFPDLPGIGGAFKYE